MTAMAPQFAYIYPEYSAPFSPEMTMIVIDRDTNIYIEWDNKYFQWKQKHQSLLLREIGSGPGPSSPPPLDLASFLDMVIKKPNTRTRG